MKKILMLFCVVLLLSAYGCGDDDGRGGGGGGEPLNVAGTWETQETVHAEDCGEGTYEQELSYMVTQDGSNLTVTDQKGGQYTGTITGRQISWTGSYEEDGGTTTLNPLTLTVGSDGTRMDRADVNRELSG